MAEIQPTEIREHSAQLTHSTNSTQITNLARLFVKAGPENAGRAHYKQFSNTKNKGVLLTHRIRTVLTTDRFRRMGFEGSKHKGTLVRRAWCVAQFCRSKSNFQFHAQKSRQTSVLGRKVGLGSIWGRVGVDLGSGVDLGLVRLWFGSVWF